MDLHFFTNLSFGWRDCLDIFLVTVIFYNLINMAKQTRAMPAILGLISILIVSVVARKLELNTLNWIVENIISSLLILVIIVFQKDIRHALSLIGSRKWWIMRLFEKEKPNTIIPIVADAAISMAQRKIGALIVFERGMPLNDTTERGTILEAKISKELLITIFWPNTPLHDGAVLIKNDQIYAAGCILPLSTAVTKHDFGTRHRAALGITEETDAVVVVVSEERGEATIAVNGRITGVMDQAKLTRVLAEAMEKN